MKENIQFNRPVIGVSSVRVPRVLIRRLRRELAASGCKQGTVSKSQAGEKDLVGVGVGQKRATPGSQKAHIPAPFSIFRDVSLPAIALQDAWGITA